MSERPTRPTLTPPLESNTRWLLNSKDLCQAIGNFIGETQGIPAGYRVKVTLSHETVAVVELLPGGKTQ